MILRQNKQLPQRLTLRKKCTFNDTKIDLWTLPSEYLKILLMLGMINKILRVTRKSIKQKQDQQNMSIHNLKKTYITNHTNSFDFISPRKSKINQLRYNKQFYTQFKRSIIIFLKQIKADLSNQNKITGRSYDTCKVLSEVNILPKSHEASIKNKQQTVFYEDSTIQVLRSEHDSENNLFKSRLESLKKLKIGPNKNISEKRRRCINKPNPKVLEQKIKKQSYMFKKYHKILYKIYTQPNPNNESRSCFQLLQLYLSNLLQIKNNITCTNFNNLAQGDGQTLSRIFYELSTIESINKKIFIIFSQILQQNQNTDISLQEQFVDIEITAKTCKQRLTQFIKQTNKLIKCVKILVKLPNFNNNLRQNQKRLAELIEKISQFRYFAKYLNIEVSHIKKQVKATENDNLMIATQKLKQFYKRKYCPRSRKN